MNTSRRSRHRAGGGHNNYRANPQLICWLVFLSFLSNANSNSLETKIFNLAPNNYYSVFPIEASSHDITFVNHYTPGVNLEWFQLAIKIDTSVPFSVLVYDNSTSDLKANISKSGEYYLDSINPLHIIGSFPEAGLGFATFDAYQSLCQYGPTPINSITGSLDFSTNPFSVSKGYCRWTITVPSYARGVNYNIDSSRDGVVVILDEKGTLVTLSPITTNTFTVVWLFSQFYPWELSWEGIYGCSPHSELTDNSGNIDSNAGDEFYPEKKTCSWLIAPTVGNSITLDFPSFNTTKDYDYVQVYDGLVLVGNYSGSDLPPRVNSHYVPPALQLVFVSTSSEHRNGWKALYSTVPCTNDLIINTSYKKDVSFSDGSGNDNYYDLTKCSWKINADPSIIGGGWVMLTFNSFYTSNSDLADNVTVYNQEGNEIFQASGDLSGNLPGPFYSLNSMLLTFQSVGAPTAPGWSATVNHYSCHPDGIPIIYTHPVGTFSAGTEDGPYVNARCNWIIRPSGASWISLSISQGSSEVYSEYFNVSTSRSSVIYEPSNPFPHYVIYNSSELYISWNSGVQERSKGWLFLWNSGGKETYPTCPLFEVVENRTGSISSPTERVKEQICSWLITPKDTKTIDIHLNFTTKQGSSDYLAILDGDDSSSPLLTNITKTTPSATFTSQSSSILIFWSSSSGESSWHIHWNGQQNGLCNPITRPLLYDDYELSSIKPIDTLSSKYSPGLNCFYVLAPPGVWEITLHFDFLETDSQTVLHLSSGASFTPSLTLSGTSRSWSVTLLAPVGLHFSTSNVPQNFSGWQFSYKSSIAPPSCFYSITNLTNPVKWQALSTVPTECVHLIHLNVGTAKPPYTVYITKFKYNSPSDYLQIWPSDKPAYGADKIVTPKTYTLNYPITTNTPYITVKSSSNDPQTSNEGMTWEVSQDLPVAPIKEDDTLYIVGVSLGVIFGTVALVAFIAALVTFVDCGADSVSASLTEKLVDRK